MVRTETTFTTNDKRLQALYDGALDVLLSSVRSFGDRNVLTEGTHSDTLSLSSSILGAATLARYDLEAAQDTVKAFLATVSKDGQLADSIRRQNGQIHLSYEKLTDFCFTEEAIGLYYLLRKKDAAYLESMLRVLLDFDAYLWEQHDLNFDGCLELFHPSDAEDEDSYRFSAVTAISPTEKHNSFPFPVESADLMACDVSIRRAIAQIYSLKNDTENAKNWTLKAINVQTQLKKLHWDEGASACFDRNARGNMIKVLGINNLYMMYHGGFDPEMAGAFCRRHLERSDGFFTDLPLPTVSVSDHSFGNRQGDRKTSGLAYRRAMDALAKYEQFPLLRQIGEKLLSAVNQTLSFSEHYDVFTGEPSGKEGSMPTASAVLEAIAYFYGIRPHLDRLLWGAAGHREPFSSEHCFHWGSDEYKLCCENQTAAGYLNGEPLFTVSSGVQVITDLYGNDPKIANMMNETIDCIFVYRNRTFSFTLAPGEVRKM